MSAMLRAGVLVATLAVLLGIASAIPVLAQSELDTGDQVVVINGTLKLRTEASVTSDVIEVLAEGTVLTVISDPVDADGLTWVQVRTATGAEGWVSSQHVEAAPPVPPQVGDTVSVESGPLNLRETASTEASVIGKLETGDRVEVVDGPVASGDYSWYQVESKDGKRGWVASDFIKVAPPEGFDPGNEVVVAIGPVNMREGSSIESEIIVTLDQGTTLTVISGPVAGGDYTWFAVKSEDGETGFVVETALEPVAGGEIEPIDFPIGSFIFASEETVVREAGMIDAAEVAKLAEGVMATVVEGPVVADGFTWFQVSIRDGENEIKGWVQGESMTGGIVLGTDAAVTDGPLNVRISASAEANAIAQLEQGDVVNVVSGPEVVEGVAWFKVTAGDDTGFVAGRYLGPVTTAQPAGSATPTPSPTATPEA